MVDFRDSWETSLQEKAPTIFHKWLQKKIEKKILKNADSIISVNEYLQNIFQKKYPQLKSSSVITNGYDEEDFIDLKPEEKSDYFTVVYLGTFNRINNPLPFFQTLSELAKEYLEFKTKTKFMHIGMSLDFDFQEIIKKYQLENLIEFKGYLTHKESLKHLSQASVLLLITTDSPGA